MESLRVMVSYNFPHMPLHLLSILSLPLFYKVLNVDVIEKVGLWRDLRSWVVLHLVT